MKKNKVLFSLLSFFFLFLNLKAQVFYRDVNPDSIHLDTLPIVGTGGSMSDSIFYLDINGDNSFDFHFYYNYNTGFAGLNRLVFIKAIDTSSRILSRPRSFVYPADTLNHLDSIFPQNFGTDSSLAAITLGNASSQSVNIHPNYFELGPHYVGFKFKIGQSFHFGWILVDLKEGVSHRHMIFSILDYGYEKTTNQGILAGARCTAGTGTSSISACEYVSFRTDTFRVDTSFVDTVNLVTGCDSILTRSFHILKSDTSIQQNICGGFRIGSNIYRRTTTVTDIQTNQFGCDSTIVWNLNYTADRDTLVTSTCSSFRISDTTFYESFNGILFFEDTIGCDTVMFLNLSLNIDSSSSSVSSCGNYNWRGRVLSSSGSYYDTLKNRFQCDSIVELKLTVNQFFFNNQREALCQSFNWRNQQITQVGIYLDTSYSSSTGCDTVHIMDAFAGGDIIQNDSITSCESFNWRGNSYTQSGRYSDTSISSLGGCREIHHLKLELANHRDTLIMAEGCESYLWNGLQLFNSGTFRDTITNSYPQCNLRRTLNLGIGKTISNTIVNQIRAGQFEAALDSVSYQWIDCDSNLNLLSGDTFKIFTEPRSGTWAVILRDAGCVDTSECFSTVSIKEKAQEQLRIYPNPTSGTVHIRAESTISKFVRFELTNIMGQTKVEFNMNSFNYLELDLPPESGVYFLKAYVRGSEPKVYRIVKE